MCLLKKYFICRSKNCLQTEEISAVLSLTCRWKKYLQINYLQRKVLRTICRPNKYVLIKTCSICVSKNYLQIDEIFHLQPEELSADQKTMHRSKNYSTCIPKNYLPIQKLFADPRIICRSKKYDQIKEVFHLQIEELSAD